VAALDRRVEPASAEPVQLMATAGRGRPSVPVEQVASVLVLQTLHSLSDREAIEALTFDLRWKAACGLAVTDAGFHPTTLTYWRRRLAASDRPERIFDAVRAVVTQTGALAGKHRRALDSTILDDAVATQDTVTQLIAAIRRVGREVPGAAEVITTHARAHDYAQAGKPRIAWDDETARAELVDAPSRTRIGSWVISPSRNSAREQPKRSDYSPWWPGRMWNRPRIPTGATGAGGSPGAPHRIA